MNNAQWLGLGMLVVATCIGIADLAILVWQTERQRVTVQSFAQPGRSRRCRSHR